MWEKYHLGHQCKNKSLFSLIATNNVLEVYNEDCLIEGEENEGEDKVENNSTKETMEMG